jgi:DNA polymerase III sliding clamp (beta) subunit (PCNA family)
MDRAALIKTLELVKPALAPKNLVPIFQCFTFVPGSVTAYNDTIAITGPCDLEETCAIHGNTLLGILSTHSAEEVSVELDEQNVTLTAGKSITKMPFEPEDNFLFQEPTGKWPNKVPFTQSMFEAMELCLETVSTDETQQALHGITFEGDCFYSCNGDTITRARVKEKIKTRVLMPTPFCEAVAKLWSSLGMTKGMLQFSDEWVFANFEDWAVYGRVLAVDNPIDFEALIKRTVKKDVTMQPIPDAFSEALSRARVLADPESQKTKVTVTKGRIKLLTETPMGEAADDLPFKGHPDIVANVNAAYIHKALQRCDLIAFHDNCVVLEKGDDVLLLVSNMG